MHKQNKHTTLKQAPEHKPLGQKITDAQKKEDDRPHLTQ